MANVRVFGVGTAGRQFTAMTTTKKAVVPNAKDSSTLDSLKMQPKELFLEPFLLIPLTKYVKY